MNLDQTPQTEWLYPPCESACIDAPVSYRHRILPGTTQTHPAVLRWGEVDSFFSNCVTVKVDRYLQTFALWRRREPGP